jgi:hypothetical protein
MTDDTRRHDIIRAIMSGNVEMNRDVSLVIASFTRDLEICHASVQQIQRTRFESVVWKEFREYSVYPKVCEAAIEQLSRRDTRATLYPVIATSVEFDLLFTALKLHSTNEYIQRNGFQLLCSSLLSMERTQATEPRYTTFASPLLRGERMLTIFSQLALVVCNIFTNLPDSSRTHLVTVIGIDRLQRDGYVDPSHLRAFHTKLLESNFLLLVLPLLEQCVTVDYKCSAIINVVDSVVNEHDTVLCEVIKSDGSQIHLVMKLTDELLELNRLDERSADKLKSLRTKLLHIYKQQ